MKLVRPIAKFYILIYIIIPIVLSSCASIAAAKEYEHPLPIRAAIYSLSESIGIDGQLIRVLSSNKVYWLNTCLDLPEPGEVCFQSTTPGWQIILGVEEYYYEFHTDGTGNQIRRRNINLPDTPHNAVLAAMNNLSTSLGASIDQIIIISYVQVNWSDVCFGLANPGELCQKKITPGWLIVLQAAGNTYEFHTDHNGGSIRSEHRFGRILYPKR